VRSKQTFVNGSERAAWQLRECEQLMTDIMMAKGASRMLEVARITLMVSKNLSRFGVLTVRVSWKLLSHADWVTANGINNNSPIILLYNSTNIRFRDPACIAALI